VKNIEHKHSITIHEIRSLLKCKIEVQKLQIREKSLIFLKMFLVEDGLKLILPVDLDQLNLKHQNAVPGDLGRGSA